MSQFTYEPKTSREDDFIFDFFVKVAKGRPGEEFHIEKTLVQQVTPKLGVEPSRKFKETLAESNLVESLLALSVEQKKSFGNLLLGKIATPIAAQDLLQKLTSEGRNLLEKMTSDELDFLRILISEEQNTFEKLISEEMERILQKLKSVVDEEMSLKALFFQTIRKYADELELYAKLTSVETKQVLNDLKLLMKQQALTSADFRTKMTLLLATVENSIPKGRL